MSHSAARKYTFGSRNSSNNSIGTSLVMKSRPRTSPYASPMVVMTFGASGKAYNIPRIFLKGYHWLSDQANTYKTPHSEEIGHVLIHYMYTGEYQILEIDDTKTGEEKTWSEFRMALQVLIALEDWNVPGLRNLVEIEIEKLSRLIHIFDIVQLTDTELVNLTIDISIESQKWINNFLLSGLKEAFQKNESDFENLTLFDRLENTALIKFLATNLFNACYSRIPRSPKRSSQVEETKPEGNDIISTVVLTPKTESSDDSQPGPKGEDSVTLYNLSGRWR